MQRIHVVVALVVALAFSGLPAFADVTVRMTLSTSGTPMAMEMTTVTYVKGQKLRTDAKGMNQDVSVLVDVPAGQQLMVNHATRQVVSFDPNAAAASLPVSFGEITMSLEPSGETRDILGRKCTGYNLSVSMPMTMANETLTMKMWGPVWIAGDGPGVEDFTRFYKAALAAGRFVPSPLGQGPQGKSMIEMQKAFAERGIPLEQEMQFGVEGGGQMAQAMGQMNMKMTMKATAISTDPIADEIFAVPAGYEKK
ncbi:MAG: hypothetical protein ACE148_11245 [Vicinamibacterales bacterium]